MFLGCGLRPNTSMHAVEELVQPPYLLGDSVDYRIILASGKAIKMRVRKHHFAGWAQRYDRLGPLLDEDGLKRAEKLIKEKCKILQKVYGQQHIELRLSSPIRHRDR